MKLSTLFGAAFATAVSILPVAAHADYSSHFQDFKLSGGIAAAKKEAAAGPSAMKLEITPHNEYMNGHTTYIWNDNEYNQIVCALPKSGDVNKAACHASYDFASARYARFAAEHHVK